MQTAASKKAGEKMKKKTYQELKAENPKQEYVKKETYDALKSVNVSLSQANEELQKALNDVAVGYNDLLVKKRELEVRIEGMVAEVRGARATVEILERDITTMGTTINTLSKSNENLVYQLDEVKESRKRTEKEWCVYGYRQTHTGLTIKELNALGQEGWNLCTITPTRFIFSRLVKATWIHEEEDAITQTTTTT